MSSTTASKFENSAVVLLANPCGDEGKLSESIREIGLHVFKTVPAQMKSFALPDVNQPRYGDYIQNFSAYVYSQVYEKSTDNLQGGYGFSIRDLKPEFLLPFTPPKLLLSWGNQGIPNDKLEKARSLGGIVEETVSGGRPALAWNVKDWNDYNKAKELDSNPRTSSNINELNPKCAIMFRVAYALVCGAIATHRYPAFIDPEHEQAVRETTAEGMEVDESVTSGYPTPPFSNGRGLLAKPYHGFTIDASKTPPPPNTPIWIQRDRLVVDYPGGDGLWFPYFAVVQEYDRETIPSFINAYMPKSLGYDIEGCIIACREMFGEGAVFGNTDTGKALTHLVYVFRLALHAQAHVIPVFGVSGYEGCIMRGAGFTINIGGKAWRPVDRNVLIESIKETSLHIRAVNSIIRVTASGEEGKKRILEAKSMLELWKVLQSTFMKPERQSEVMDVAKYLNYGDTNWPVNTQTLGLAFNRINDPDLNLKSELGKDFPIHHSMLFSKNTREMIWSCFGSFAPSFMIPGGKKFHLKENMEYEVKVGKGRDSQTRKLVRIVVRIKPLKEALVDLEMMTNEKSILNPLVLTQARVSAKYMDRVFEGERGTELLGLLRGFCKVEASGKKRVASEGHGEEPAEKKTRRVDDW